jgi:hypothetical protein
MIERKIAGEQIVPESRERPKVVNLGSVRRSLDESRRAPRQAAATRGRKTARLRD